MDFLASNKDTTLSEKIATVTKDLAPEGTVEVGYSFGPKERGGPIHCFIEFYGKEAEPLEEVISDDMRLNAEI